MDSFMEKIKSLLGLLGTLDESGEGYEPSPFSRMLAVDSKTDYKQVDFGDKKYTGSKKILIVAPEERYMTMENGKKFSSGCHPVELTLPLMHLVNAGFDFDVATPTGKPVCVEMWALPTKDETILKFFTDTVQPKLNKPLNLADVVKSLYVQTTMDAYVCLFLPGGHGAMLGLPEDPNLSKAIHATKAKDLYLLSVCHGPAALLAAKTEPHPYNGYKIACFPDSVDKQTPMIGYLPGPMPWYFGEKLVERGFNIVNTGADGTVEVDRKLITGASPKACQELGKTAAEALLKEYVE